MSFGSNVYNYISYFHLGILSPVIFSVTRTMTLGPVAEDTTVIFDNITRNTGDGFDPETSRFIAPITGAYFFSYVFDAYYAELDLYMNQVMIRSSTMTKMTDSLKTLLILLNRGDYLMFQLKASGLTKMLRCAEYQCEFSGYFMKQIQ